MDGVTSGDMSGTSGGAGGRLLRLHPWRAGYVVCSPLLLVAILVNVTSTLYEVPADVAAWKPFAWELSSFVGCLAALWIPFAALDRVPLPTVRWARATALHLAAATAFSTLHCTVMWSARRAVYTLMAEPYGWTIPLGKILYEYRKDLFTYLVISVQRDVLGPAPVGGQPVAWPRAGRHRVASLRRASLWRASLWRARYPRRRPAGAGANRQHSGR